MKIELDVSCDEVFGAIMVFLLIVLPLLVGLGAFLSAK